MLLAGGEEGIHHGCALAGFMGTGEEVVLASQGPAAGFYSRSGYSRFPPPDLGYCRGNYGRAVVRRSLFKVYSSPFTRKEFVILHVVY